MQQRRAPDSRTIHLSYGRGLFKQCYPSGCFGLWNTKIWTSTWIIGRIRRKSSPARVGTIRTCHFSYRETLTPPYCLGPPRVVRQRCLTGASTGQTQGGNTDSCLRSSDRLSLLSIPPRALYRMLVGIEKPFTASRPERKSRNLFHYIQTPARLTIQGPTVQIGVQNKHTPAYSALISP
jgi:hypothetical protein